MTETEDRTGSQPKQAGASLSALEALHLSMARADAFSTWVSNADTKISILAGTDAVLAVAVVTSLPRSEGAGRGAFIAATVPLLLSLLALAWASRYLLTALRPRLRPAAASRFTFPADAAAVLPIRTGDDIEQLAEESDQQAAAVADIARIKFTEFARALSWSAAAIFAGIVGLAVSALTGT